MGSNVKNIREEVVAVSNEWETCPAKRKQQVLDQFFESVEGKIVNNGYLNVDNVREDLKIAKELMSKFKDEYRTFTKSAYELKIEINRAVQRLHKVELYMRNILESANDIPKDHKDWMEKHCVLDIDFIKESLFRNKYTTKDVACSLKNMGGKVEKRKKLKREEVGQQYGSEAFNKENYMLIEDEKEKYMLLQRKREEYMLWEQEIRNLYVKWEKVLEPYRVCGPEFPFYFYKENAERIVEDLKKEVEQFVGI